MKSACVFDCNRFSAGNVSSSIMLVRTFLCLIHTMYSLAVYKSMVMDYREEATRFLMPSLYPYVRLPQFYCELRFIHIFAHFYWSNVSIYNAKYVSAVQIGWFLTRLHGCLYNKPSYELQYIVYIWADWQGFKWCELYLKRSRAIFACWVHLAAHNRHFVFLIGNKC